MLSDAAQTCRNMIRYISCKSKWLVDQLRKRWFSVIGSRHYVALLRRKTPSAPLSGRLFIDVSVICQSDAETGIQRVVRSVALFLTNIDDAHMARPIFVHTHKARHYVVELRGGDYNRTTQLVEYAAGDVFIGLDYALDALWRLRHELARMRRKGVRFWFVVHDLLPMTNPDWFSPPTVLRFGNWLAIIAATADGFFCVSAPVAQQLCGVIRSRFGLGHGYETVVIPMGWEFSASKPSTGLPHEFAATLKRIEAAPSVLMVGTIEPRKGHGDALAAMELLWARGVDANLVLVGAAGWKTEALCACLAGHNEAGRRLFVMGKVSDEALEILYMSCTGILVPSLAEGFGLPVVEALGRGKPVLARDLEVFAQHADKGVTYFARDADPAGLAQAIHDWLLAAKTPQLPCRAHLPTWQDTARVIHQTATQSLARP